MPLSKSQAELLEYCHLPEELQRFLGQELGEHGLQKSTISPDFLHILCNLLQIYETRLENLRYKFAKTVNIDGQQPIVAIPPPQVSMLEEEVKTAWTRAAALWKATDLVVGHPDLFGVTLKPAHVEYALDKHNLPVVEMIRWARPDFFELKPIPKAIRYLSGFIGALGGAFIGLWGGAKGGAIQADRLPMLKFLRPIVVVCYGFAGLISGSAMGSMMGSSLGFQTGNVSLAFQFAYLASNLNPFHDPIGSKYQRAVQLCREKILFKLAEEYSGKKELENDSSRSPA